MEESPYKSPEFADLAKSSAASNRSAFTFLRWLIWSQVAAICFVGLLARGYLGNALPQQLESVIEEAFGLALFGFPAVWIIAVVLTPLSPSRRVALCALQMVLSAVYMLALSPAVQ